MLQKLTKLTKAIISTFKDPDLLSSRPHHGDEIAEDDPRLSAMLSHDYEKDAQEGWWTCSQCRIVHTSDMLWVYDKQGLLCQQCCDDLNHQGASEAEKESRVTITTWDDGEFQVQLDGNAPTNYSFDNNDQFPPNCKVLSFKQGNLRITIQNDKNKS